MPMTEPYRGHQADPVPAGLRGRCPRCGDGRLFKGFVSLNPRCEACKLDFAFADSGDGPAVFIILIAGFLIVFLALAVEVVYSPPYWLHLLIFLPLTLIVSLGLLRPMKGLMIGLQYRNKAGQGHLEK
jgi:uncharacterized protein (DUF983 family)